MDTDMTPARALVLVVQDEPILTFAMVEHVEAAECEAVVAPSAAEAVRVLELRTDIRAVYADLDMRGSLMGMKLAATIRDRWPPLELLLVSTQDRDEETLPARAILVGKPFDEGRIVAALRRFTR